MDAKIFQETTKALLMAFRVIDVVFNESGLTLVLENDMQLEINLETWGYDGYGLVGNVRMLEGKG